LGVSRQGEFENTAGEIKYISKKKPGNIFSGGGRGVPGGFFLLFFLSAFFVALVKRLSVRGTRKRDKKCVTGSCVHFFPLVIVRQAELVDFFIAVVGVSR
jgi:hypothetical protein